MTSFSTRGKFETVTKVSGPRWLFLAFLFRIGEIRSSKNRPLCKKEKGTFEFLLVPLHLLPRAQRKDDILVVFFSFFQHRKA